MSLAYRGNTYAVGKILYRPGSRAPIFFAKLRPTDLLRTLDAWSVAPEVLEHLGGLGGMEVHLYAPWESCLYIADIATIRKLGVLASMNPKIGRRYHLSRRHWSTGRLNYRVPFFDEVVTINVEPEAEQLVLFEEA